MNFAYVHLLLNHIPIIGIPIALVFLLQSLITNNANTRRFSYLVLVGLAAVVVPVYFTGEPAEGVVEHMPGVTEEFISAHENAALFALVLTILAGITAAAAVWIDKKEAKAGKLSNLVVGITTIAMVSLLYTAKLGGRVRHVEIRDGAGQVVEGEARSEGEEKEKGEAKPKAEVPLALGEASSGAGKVATQEKAKGKAKDKDGEGD